MSVPSTPIRTCAVIPHGSATRSTPRSIKRLISPTSLQSPSKRSLLVVSPNQDLPKAGQLISIGEYCPLRQLFPDQQAHVVDEQPTWHTNNVLVPFDMRDLSIAIDEGNALEVLGSIFPQTIGIMESVPARLWLNFHVEQLPSRPWPVTVGGLPITIRTDAEGRGPLFPKRRCGNARISICPELDGTADDYLSDSDARLVLCAVARHFRAHHPDIELCEVLFTMQNHIYVVLNGPDLNINALAHQLPGKIARCYVGYLRQGDIGQPQSHEELRARRVINPDPATHVLDTTAYDTLRPGVMLWSDKGTHDGPETFSTTAGVLVKTELNHVFMTGASHGFGDDGIVYQQQPDGSKRKLGRAVQEIPHTGIALVRLEDDMIFVNDTFEDDSGNAPAFTRLLGERPGDLDSKTKGPNTVYLNSPFSGTMEGSVVIRSFRMKSSDYAGERDVDWVAHEWIYTGQVEGADEGEGQPPPGVCGSAIWDDEGVIHGFSRHYVAQGPMAGFCISVRASELVEAGYRLV